MGSMKVSFVTFGCKVNQYEEELMKQLVENAGHTVVKPCEADIVVFNSCAVTGEAIRKLKQKIRHVRRENPDARLMVVGCAVDFDPQELEDVEINLLAGNSLKRKIVELLNAVPFEGIKFEKDLNCEDFVRESLLKRLRNRTRGMVKVEDGCDGYCTYCAVRLARGNRVRSKPVGLVMEEIRKLVDSGHREIVIVGINLGRYGVDMGLKLSDLLKVVEKMEGDFRVRLSSLNPDDIDEELLDVICEKRFCRHLHISLQSASNNVLSLMRRRYRVEKFWEIFERLRKFDPLYSFSFDIMVGFPGESESDFLESVELVRRVKPVRVHVFRFSPRRGTPACDMRPQISGAVKKERARYLKEIFLVAMHEYLLKHDGVKRRVLVEKVSNGLSSGYDEYYIHNVLNESREEGEFVECFAVSVMKGEEATLSSVPISGWKVG